MSVNIYRIMSAKASDTLKPVQDLETWGKWILCGWKGNQV